MVPDVDLVTSRKPDDPPRSTGR
ncbi:MAG: hypothetical protein WAK63_07075 [Xanthobacteraceae bacterium]